MPFLGTPLMKKTTIGPLAAHGLKRSSSSPSFESLERGAKCLLGGHIPEGPGFFYPPTILTNVTKGMPAYDEELFGPVAALIVAKDEQEAIQMANDTAYGLGASVFTQDLARARRIALKDLDAGSCFVNAQVKKSRPTPSLRGGLRKAGLAESFPTSGLKNSSIVKRSL